MDFLYPQKFYFHQYLLFRGKELNMSLSIHTCIRGEKVSVKGSFHFVNCLYNL